ncbi:hypothetical protein [Longitalea arenae]|uniref:hypothetical protein n=1 Tax=Longitalea arenae TaxID=2812558 RepID=UPI001968919F|nr:hypothetical protein [Longitalea arenae]
MKLLSVSAKLWWKTVFLNALFFGTWAALTGDIFDMLGSVIVLVAGYITTVPLIIIIAPLLNISTMLPYSIPARIAWLTFHLIIVVVLFYMFFSVIEKGALFVPDSYAVQLMRTTIAGLLIAVFTTRRSITKLYSEI